MRMRQAPLSRFFTCCLICEHQQKTVTVPPGAWNRLKPEAPGCEVLLSPSLQYLFGTTPDGAGELPQFVQLMGAGKGLEPQTPNQSYFHRQRRKLLPRITSSPLLFYKNGRAETNAGKQPSTCKKEKRGARKSPWHRPGYML